MNACACHDPAVFGHVWPCPRSERHVPPPDRAAQLLAAILRIQEGTRTRDQRT